MVIVLIAISISVVVDIIYDEAIFFAIAGDIVYRVLSGLVSVVGWTTLIFSLIERYSSPDDLEEEAKDEEWDPYDLPALSADKQVWDRIEHIWSNTIEHGIALYKTIRK